MALQSAALAAAGNHHEAYVSSCAGTVGCVQQHLSAAAATIKRTHCAQFAIHACSALRAAWRRACAFSQRVGVRVHRCGTRMAPVAPSLALRLHRACARAAYSDLDRLLCAVGLAGCLFCTERSIGLRKGAEVLCRAALLARCAGSPKAPSALHKRGIITLRAPVAAMWHFIQRAGVLHVRHWSAAMAKSALQRSERSLRAIARSLQAACRAPGARQLHGPQSMGSLGHRRAAPHSAQRIALARSARGSIQSSASKQPWSAWLCLRCSSHACAWRRQCGQGRRKSVAACAWRTGRSLIDRRTLT